MNALGKRAEWLLGPTEVGKGGDIVQTAGKPHHFSALLHHLFKAQGLLVLHQQIEACLQTVVKYNPWFPDEGSFDLEIWNRVKENVEQVARWRENIPINFWPLWALIKATILPFQGNSSPPDIRQQAEHSLYEYKLDDEMTKGPIRTT